MDLLNQLACLLYTVLGKKRWQKLTLSFSLYHSLTLLYCFKVSVQLLAHCVLIVNCYLIHLFLITVGHQCLHKHSCTS